jgi:hypothetical protein
MPCVQTSALKKSHGDRGIIIIEAGVYSSVLCFYVCMKFSTMKSIKSEWD